MNKQITVKIRKITLGKDGKTYLVIEHPLVSNYPSLVLKKDISVKDFFKKNGGDIHGKEK